MPYSYSQFKSEIKDFIYKKYPKDSKILDIGAGCGPYAQLLPDYKNIDAVEIFEPYIIQYNLKSLYKNVFYINILDFDFEYYDLIIMGDVMEHLTTEDALKLFNKIFNKCNDIIVVVPYLYVQDAVNGNDYEEHKQNDLTKDIMKNRYSMLSMKWSDDKIGVYFKNRKLTVLIPYRDREENLSVFIPYFKSFMKNYHPEINYNIVIIEQGNNKTFNKGLLFNAGFLLTSGSTDYYALHDVDALPLSSDYSYHVEPQHLFVNTLEQSNNGIFRNINREALYKNKGGVITVSKEIFKLVNGFSNNYWGWGFEDDDFSFRLHDAGHHLQRYGTRMNHGGLENNDRGYYVIIYAKSVRFHENKYYTINHDYAYDVVCKKIDWRLEGLNTTKFKVNTIVTNRDYKKYTIDFENDAPEII